MFIKFKTIRWRNFLATGNDWIEFQLDRYDRTIIYGENGAGKSTLLDALAFALFGKAFRNINKPLLVNSINQEDCLVELEFFIGQTNYQINRGIKPNVFEIYVNGQMKDQNAGIYDYQGYLETNILKFNFKTFKQIMALGSKSFVPFMQLVALDRRNVIEELLDIQIFSAMARVTRNKLDDLRGQIFDIDQSIKVIQEKIDLQKINILQNTSQNESKISTNIQIIENNQNVINQHNINVLEAEERIAILMDQTLDHAKVQKQLLELNRLEATMKQNWNRYNHQHKFFLDNNNCPTCEQDINQIFKTNQLEKHSVKLSDLQTGLSNIEKVIKETTENLNSIIMLQDEIQQHRTNIQISKEKIKALQLWEINLLKENADLADISYDAEHNDVMLQRFLKELEIEQIKRSHKIALKKYLDLTASFLKDGGIKTSIVRQYLPIMNNLINKYLSYMDFFAQFTLNENFEESILARHRDKFAYESFSNGATIAIDLALLFAWRSVAKIKNSVDTNILIMDEIIDSSLDNQGTEDFFKLISACKDTNIFIISPKGDVLVDKFDNSIKFELKQNFSEIVG